MYKSGHHGKCSVILEAVTDYDLWIWHAYFSTAGAANDINVLHRSNVFKKLCDGLTPRCNYVINGHEYDKGYYLADGIYPTWSTFVKTIHNPVGEARVCSQRCGAGFWCAPGQVCRCLLPLSFMVAR